MAAPPPSADRAPPTPAPQVRRPQLPHPRRPGRVLVTGMAVVLLAALGPPARAEDPPAAPTTPPRPSHPLTPPRRCPRPQPTATSVGDPTLPPTSPPPTPQADGHCTWRRWSATRPAAPPLARARGHPHRCRRRSPTAIATPARPPRPRAAPRHPTRRLAPPTRPPASRPPPACWARPNSWRTSSTSPRSAARTTRTRPPSWRWPCQPTAVTVHGATGHQAPTGPVASTTRPRRRSRYQPPPRH